MTRIGRPFVAFTFLVTVSVAIYLIRDDYNRYTSIESSFGKKWTSMSTEITKDKHSKYTTVNITKPSPVEDIQQKRRTHLLQACERLNSEQHPVNFDHLTVDTLKKMNHIFVLDKLKTLYCYIPKAGCTTMKRILLLLNGNIKTTSIEHETVHKLADKHFPLLGKYSLEDAKVRIKTYRKLIFVREPFSRILSAYRDKLDLNGSCRTEYWSRKINGHANQKVTRNNDFNITFVNFVHYLGNLSNKLNIPKEEHWREFYRLCHPCRVPYDFIGHFETFYKDVREGVQKIVDGVEIDIPQSSNPTKSSNSGMLSKYYSQVSSTQLESLYKRLETDIELFNYQVPPFIADRINNSASRRKRMFTN